jgi:hypothetical protein
VGARSTAQGAAATTGSGSSSSSGATQQQPPQPPQQQQPGSQGMSHMTPSASAPANVAQPPDTGGAGLMMQEGGLMHGSSASLSRPGGPSGVSPIVAAANAAAAQDAAAAVAAAQATAAWGQGIIRSSGRMQAPGVQGGAGVTATGAPTLAAPSNAPPNPGAPLPPVPPSVASTARGPSAAAGAQQQPPSTGVAGSQGQGMAAVAAAAKVASAASLRRVELVILHPNDGSLPQVGALLYNWTHRYQ